MRSSSTTPLQTYDPRVYAVGECVQHRGATFGLARADLGPGARGGAHLAGAGHRRYVQRATATKLKRDGETCIRRATSSARRAPRTSCCAIRDAASTSASCSKNDRVIGAVLYGDVKDGGWYFELIQNRTDISAPAQPAAFRPGACRGGACLKRADSRLNTPEPPE